MRTTDSTPLLEAFLLIEQPRQRLGHWTRALAPLDSPDAPPTVAIVAYYDPTCDQALINLQYDERALGETRLDYVVNVALLAELGMVQPAELSEGERVRFLADRLSRCTIRVLAQQSAASALFELVRKIKSDRNKPMPPPLPKNAVRSVGPRGDTQDPVMLVQAKGTRDNLERVSADLLGTGPEPPPPPRRSDEPLTSSRHIVPRMKRATTAEMPVEVSERLTEYSRIGPMPRRTQTQDPLLDPYRPTSQKAQVIYARYLRGGRWVPVRVGALSLKGAALLTGALPRLHDRVDIALVFGAQRALVHGEVSKVSTVREAQATGAATFSVSFMLDAASRKQLTGLLMSARDAKITIKPPPPRATRRFPVEWPIALGTTKGAIKSHALDVSTGGMFVRPTIALELGSTVSFSVVLDDGSAPIAGRATVVREITKADAKQCGLAPGYGLGISEMSEADRMRWLGFLARIERRAEKRVLIGAEPNRLAELQAGLASLGYAVTGGTDPGTLVQLANGDARPADAVLIDAGWLDNNDAGASLVESLFSARNVPCVTMNGEVRRARQAIDRLLEVVV